MRPMSVLFGILAIVMVSACTPSNKNMESEERVQKTVARFYRNASDAYFMIGWEYYNLAQEMEKSGKTEQAQSYAAKSRIYATISKEWKKMAAQTEDGGDVTPAPAPASPAPAAGGN